jgi:hypothetical protein
MGHLRSAYGTRAQVAAVQPEANTGTLPCVVSTIASSLFENFQRLGDFGS